MFYSILATRAEYSKVKNAWVNGMAVSKTLLHNSQMLLELLTHKILPQPLVKELIPGCSILHTSQVAPDRPLQPLRLAAPRSDAPGSNQAELLKKSSKHLIKHLIWRICHFCRGFIYHRSQMVQIFFQQYQLQHPILVRFFATRNQQPILFSTS